MQTASRQIAFRERFVLTGQKSLMGAIKMMYFCLRVCFSGKINRFDYHVLCQWQCWPKYDFYSFILLRVRLFDYWEGYMCDLVWVNLRSGWECMRTAKIGPDLRLIGLGKNFFPKPLVIFFQHYTPWKICFQCRIFFFARNFLPSPQKWNGRPLRTTTLEKRLFSHSYNF